MDRALLSRFPVKIEMNPLKKDKEFELLKDRFNINNPEELELLENVCDIAAHTREQIKLEESKLTNFIPTRSTVEIAELITDGFNLIEIAETTIYPNFSDDGGIDSERTYMKQLVQKYIKTTDEELYTDPVEKDSVPF